MTEYTIQRICVCCGLSFSCSDGDYFCDSKCEYQWEARQCELDEDEY